MFAGQQGHVLPSLPQLAQSNHNPVSWAGLRPISRWCPGEAGGRAVCQVSPWPVQTWGQGLGLWGVPEHGERPLLKLLLTHSHPEAARSLEMGMFLGPDLLAALFLSSSCPQRRSFRDFCLQLLNHCHSSKTHLCSLVRYLVLLSFCSGDFVVPGVSRNGLPRVYKTEKPHVSPAYPTISNTHQNRNSVIVQHALLSHLWFWKNAPFFCVRTLSNQKYKNISVKNTPNIKISRFPTILTLSYIYMDMCAWVTDVDKQ